MSAAKDDQKLLAMVQLQVERMMAELSDLESMREDLDDEEYASSKAEAELQLAEFTVTLNKLKSGGIGIDDTSGPYVASSAGGSAVQAAKSNELSSLRSKLTQLETDNRLGKISPHFFVTQAGDVVQKLSQMGAVLSSRESEIADAFSGHGESLVSLTASEEGGVTSAKVMSAVRQAL